MSKPLSSACTRPHRTIGQFLSDLRLGTWGFLSHLFPDPCSVVRGAAAKQCTTTASRTATTSKQHADAAGEPLQKLYDSERAAAETGSPAAVEDASQKLAAIALWEMASFCGALRYDDAINNTSVL